MLLQNVGFYNTQNAVLDDNLNRALIAGGDQIVLDSWGFGMVDDPKGARFVPGADLMAMNRTSSLVGTNTYNIKSNFFTRRRPKYDTLGMSQILDVKALGAKGDGVTDDTTVLNSILTRGANMSAIVYFPHGIYVIKDTLKVPKNSRVLGQAWSQIMATGTKFEDASNPHVAVQVGEVGDIGIVEIQDLLFTVKGPTAGAVLVEWNIHESSQGSAGLWGKIHTPYILLFHELTPVFSVPQIPIFVLVAPRALTFRRRIVQRTAIASTRGVSLPPSCYT